MSTILAAANGDWHTGATWTGGVVPGPGDVAVLNGKAITIEQDVTCSEIRSDSTGGAVQGGTCTVDVGGVTVTANLYSGYAAGRPSLLEFTAYAPESLNIVGNCVGVYDANSCRVVRNTATGTVNITGDVSGSCYGNGVVSNASSGSMVITGTVTATGSLFSSSWIALNAANGTLTINGNVNGPSYAAATPVYNQSNGLVTINGDVTGGTVAGAYGATNKASGTIIVNGRAIADGGQAILSDASGSLVVLRGAVFSPTGLFPVAGGRPVKFDRTAAVQVTFRDTDSNEFTLYEPADLPTYPAASDVRSGVLYGPDDTLTGTCAVPPPESVSFGVPTDDTTGTLQLDPAELALAVWAASTRSLTDKEGFGASAADTAAAVWAAEVRSLTDKTGFGATPAEVWSHEARSLTDKDGFGAAVEDIWTHPQRTLTETPLTAADVWQYSDRGITGAPAIESALGNVWQSVSELHDRIAEQVTSGPVVVVPSPDDGQTTAWCMCYRGDGTLAPNISVEIWIEGAGKGGHGLFSSEHRTVTADENGMLSFAIPRNTLLRFALQAANGQKVSFQGVDADTLELPIIIA